MHADISTLTSQPSLTDHPVHFFEVVTVATVLTFARKGRVFEERRVDMCHREEEEERAINIPEEEKPVSHECLFKYYSLTLVLDT